MATRSRPSPSRRPRLEAEQHFRRRRRRCRDQERIFSPESRGEKAPQSRRCPKLWHRVEGLVRRARHGRRIAANQPARRPFRRRRRPHDRGRVDCRSWSSWSPYAAPRSRRRAAVGSGCVARDSPIRNALYPTAAIVSMSSRLFIPDSQTTIRFGVGWASTRSWRDLQDPPEALQIAVIYAEQASGRRARETQLGSAVAFDQGLHAEGSTWR